MSGTVSCPSCGREVARGDRFCSGCGSEVTQALETATGQGHDVGTNPTQCLKCGAAMGREDKFCPQCGTSRPEEATVVSHVSLRNAQAAKLIEATRGEFEILRELGSGAMGAVYLGKDIALGRMVAIKVIAPHLLSDETMISRFRLEAQTVASLRHPNIVNVHAVKQSDDLHYFVMEYVDGPPLRSIVKTHAPLDVEVVQGLLFQVGSALNYAHRKGGGVIHRDIKPANIMVDREGDAFVTDFGISKIAESKTGLTQTGATIGTPEYMSPEQCRGDALTGASDQYALGVVAYEMLCGHTPFSGSQYYIMVAHTSEKPTPIREVRPDCPATVAEAVERMLAKTPEERWPDLELAMRAMGGMPLGYQDPTRTKIVALTGSTLTQVPAVTTKPSGGGPVTADTATKVSVTGLPAVVETGDMFTLEADIQGTGGVSLPGLGVEWASTDPSIARVDGGVVQALQAGSVSITATAGNVANSVLLTVAEPAPARVLVSPGSVTIHQGGRIALRAQVHDRKGRGLDREVSWLSSDPSIATVTQEGSVVAAGTGPVTITAESGGVSGFAEIVVEPSATGETSVPEGVTPIEVPAAVEASTRGAAATVVVPRSGEVPVVPTEAPPAPPPKPTPPKPRYDTEPARPAYRHPAAIAAAIAALLAVGYGVVAVTGGGAGDAGVDDGPAAAGAAAAPFGASDEAAALSADDPAPVSGGPASAPAPSLTADAATNAVADAEAPATEPAATDAAPVTQDEPPPVVADRPPPADVGADAPQPPPAPVPSRLTIALPSSSMEVGGTQAANAQVFSAAGARMTPGQYDLAWQSSDPAVISVDSQGRVTAQGPGSATLVATAGAARGSVAVNVAVTIGSVEIADSDLSLEVGQSRSLSASVVDSRGQPMDFGVTWSSSNPGVATVDAGTGRVTSVSPGNAQITAAADTFTDQISLTVVAPAPALPSAGEARAAVQAVADALGGGDRDAVTRFWGTGDPDGLEEVLDLMGRTGFSASLGPMSDPEQAGQAASVSFEVEARYRTSFGGNQDRTLGLRAQLVRAGLTWQVSALTLQ